jgi:hypothetical protein
VHPEKIADDYNEDENKRYNDLLEQAIKPFRAINFYRINTLLRNIIYLTKVYVDSSIFAGYEQLAEMTYEQLKNYLSFLFENMEQKKRGELVDLLDEFIEFIPTINNYYLIDNKNGQQYPWSGFIKKDILESLSNAIPV